MNEIEYLSTHDLKLEAHMPHCIVEHSSSLNAKDIIPLAYSGALRSELFEPGGKDIKVRAMSYSNYHSEPGTKDFIHVTLKILSGRNPEQKKMLSNSVLEKLRELTVKACALSVEVVDVDRESYSKFVAE